MKNPIQFKSFIPFRVEGSAITRVEKLDTDCVALQEAPDTIAHLMSVDPSKTSWRSQGFVNVLNDVPVHAVSTGIFLMAVQFNERKLPGKVRDEHLGKLLKKWDEREGRKPGKKDYAILREQAEFELLPHAFITRTVVPVLFFKRDRIVLICTSSPKRADETMASLLGLMHALDASKQPAWHYIAANDNPVTAMTALVTNTNNIDGTDLHTAGSAMLKGEGKEVIRIKDRDLGSVEVQRIFKQPYTVHEVRLQQLEDGTTDPSYAFTVTDKLVFKGFKFGTVVNEERGADKDDLNSAFASTAWICATTFQQVLKEVMTFFGGMTSTKIEHADLSDKKDALNEEEDDGSL